ncbi:MAG: hypothetical protein ACKVH5_01090 [Fidelibacterota bacterium]|jgi:hypothetical protein|nr:hypothetical protein [Candidatus Neomarinimicrobiota bacterium]MBT4752720.1 hypothetical protein [Candidatus Neomarinimicrobiota bacterium]MBT6518160.1 hypothetical protein [Candidatus Neomarinimicrobiota bacterium]MBT6711229.1 hypothetical protein [Candidatus Neomarinimicrobiota bacterium]
MKVKLFSKCGKYFGKSNTADRLEEDVNLWLENQSGIKIVEIKQSSCGGSMEPGQHLISVWYDEAG